MARRADNRADDDKPVHHRRDPGKNFANLDTGYARGNGLEFTANFNRSLGLNLPHVLMWGSASQKDIDDGLLRRTAAPPRFRAQDVGQCQSRGTEAEHADLHEATAGDAVTE